MSENKVVNGEEMVEEVIANEEPVEVDSNSNTEELAPLSSASLAHYDEATQKEILRTAGEIDVTQFDKVMAYGSIPVMRTFELAGKVLKEAEGTSADQEVVKMVAELAKKAKDEYSLVIQEPNFVEKFVMKLVSGFKSDSHDTKVKAISCFKVLQQYVKSCDKWLENLRKAEESILLSGRNKLTDCYELEQYIVAGRIAEKRIEGEVESAQQEWNETGMVDSKMKYDDLHRGLNEFRIVLQNLEKSRAAHGLTIGELALELNANRRIQLTVDSQKIHSSTVMAQQLEVAYYDAVNKEALEGQKAITEVNNRLLDEVAKRVVATGEEAEKILVNGVYSVEAAQQAAETVITGYETIKKASEESIGQISANMEKLKGVVDQLTPYIEKLKTSTDKTSSGKTISDSSTKSGLVF